MHLVSPWWHYEWRSYIQLFACSRAPCSIHSSAQWSLYISHMFCRTTHVAVMLGTFCKWQSVRLRRHLQCLLADQKHFKQAFLPDLSVVALYCMPAEGRDVLLLCCRFQWLYMVHTVVRLMPNSLNRVRHSFTRACTPMSYLIRVSCLSICRLSSLHRIIKVPGTKQVLFPPCL